MDIEKPTDETKPAKWDSKVKDYVRQVADLLRLKDWTVVLDEGNVADATSMGEVECIYGRKVAYIKFNHDRWPRYTKDQKRHTVVHELLHCHAEGVADFVRIAISSELSQSAANVFRTAFRQHSEYMIDGLTDTLASLMPEYPD